MANNYITRLRNHLLALASVLVTASGFAQTTLTYTGTAAADERRPYGVYFGHERTQAVYNESTELLLPVGSIITDIGFFLSGINNPPGASFPVKIYMREVASGTVTQSTVTPLEIPANLVYQGNMTPADWAGGNHWVTRPLTYNGPTLITSGGFLEIFVETDWQFVNTCCGWFPQAGNPNNIIFSHNTKTAGAQWWQNDGALNNSLNGQVVNSRPNLQLTYVAATPCPSAPPAGSVTAVASSNPVCAVPFNLSLTGVPPQSGFTFQWFVSTAGPGGPYSPIGGATSPFYQLIQTTPSWYYCQITCTGFGSSNSSVVAVGQNPPTNCYCSSGATFSGDGDIGNVTFGNSPNWINNIAGGCTPTYSNALANATYTNYTQTVPVPNIMQGSVQPISMCQITSGTFLFTSYFNTFIDYNLDGTFDPLYERVYSAGSTTNSGPYSFSSSITIPFSSVLGRTRMRVINTEGGNNTQSPCGTFGSWGETEDYDIMLVNNPTVCSGPTQGTTVSTLSNICASTTFIVSIVGNSQGTGQYYQWDSSTVSAAGPWSACNNPLNYSRFIYYSTRTNATTWYRCRQTCGTPPPTTGAIDALPASTPVQVTINPPSQCYCNTNLHIVDCSQYWVSNVSLNGAGALNNSTGCTAGNGLAYTAYPASGSTTTTITQNQTYNLSVTTQGTFSQSISVWIDWNGSGTFDASEWFGLTGNPAAVQPVGTYTLPITVPASSVTGLTGMRVRSRINTINGPNDACIQFGSGETEDYLITIAAFVPPTCNGTSNLTTTTLTTNATPCSGQQINLSLSPNLVITYSNLAYQWQIDTNGTWQSIVGGTGPTLLTNLTTRYARFRCQVTCTACCVGSPVNSAPQIIDNSPALWMGGSGTTPNSDWSNGANWCGRVPTNADSALIAYALTGRPAAQYASPVASSGTAVTAYNLQINNGATDSLTVLTDSLNSFNITQHIVNSGKISFNSTRGDTVPFSSTATLPPSALYTPFRGAISDQICQIIYSASELNAFGIRRNDVIDSLFFHFRSQTSTLPYQNFKISYGFTTQTQFTSTALLPVSTQIYFNPSLDVATLVPGTAGTLKLGVTNFAWTDTTQNIVLQICFNTTGVRAGGNDLLYNQNQTNKAYLQLSTDNIGDDGCAITASTTGVSTSFTPTFSRPNITFRFHRPQRPITATIGTSTLVGGGLKNNGGTSALYASMANITITGTVNNDGAIRLDSTNLIINPSNVAWPTTDYVNTLLTDFTYTPWGFARKSQIYFNGNNFTNNGTFTPGSKSRVVFGGTLNQTIGGTQVTTFNAFRLDKPANTQTITLNQSMAVNDTMVLDTGRVIMNQKSITINNPATWAITKINTATTGVLISEDTLSKVNWNIGTTTGAHVIPFANTNAVAYVPFTFNHVSGDLGVATAATYGTNSSNLPYPPGPATDPYPLQSLGPGLPVGSNNAALTADRYWILSKSSAVAANTNFVFNFSDVERTSGGTAPGSITTPNGMSATNPAKAQPWGGPAGGGWRTAPGTQVYSFSPPIPTVPPAYIASRINTVTLTGYTWNHGNSNPWAISPSSSPLPIKLVSFTGKPVDMRSKLNWITASEKDNDYFTVIRTKDFNSITEITRVKSQGNSNDLQYYEAWDENPENGVNYYRLLQTDIGGSAVPASDYVAIRFGKEANFEILYVTNETELQVFFDYNSDEPVNYTVTDMLGKVVASGLNNAATEGVNMLKIDASAWTRGMYLISLQNSEKRVTQKLVY